MTNPNDSQPLIPDVQPPTRSLTRWRHGGRWITEYRPQPVPRPELPRRFCWLGALHRAALALWFTLRHIEHGIAPGGHVRALVRVVGRVLVLVVLGWIVLSVLLPVAMLAATVLYHLMLAAIYLVVAAVLIAALVSSRR